MEADMREDVDFLADYLVTEYGIHQEGDHAVSGDIDELGFIGDDEFHSDKEAVGELFF